MYLRRGKDKEAQYQNNSIFDLAYVVLWRVFHHEIRRYDIIMTLNNLAGGKALATNHRESSPPFSYASCESPIPLPG